MRCLLAVCLALLLAAPLQAQAKKGKRPPNILIILCDDVGYGEFGFQGRKDVPTPHIDSIARKGLRFTQGYVSGPYCSPTRAGLLTGRYQTRFGHEFNPPSPKNGLPLSETTLADLLRRLGYATCAIGKWHLGADPSLRPTARGFDEFFGTLNNTPFFHPTNFIDSRVAPDVKKIDDPKFYTTEQYGDRAVDWITKNQKKPWFLYLPFNAQHAPLQAPQKYLDKFAHIKDEKRQYFAAMMSAMDDAVGRVLAKIAELGQEEETLIIFFSDNGGPTMQTTSNNGVLRGVKATTLEGGVRVPFCMQWKGTLPAGKDYEHPIIQLDLLPTCIAAAGGEVDAKLKIDGVNLLPYLKGEKKERPHDTFFWRFGEQWAVRKGDWKLVVSRIDGPEPKLFNLAEDIGEAKDLTAAQPDKVKELKTLYDAWNAEQAKPLWDAPKNVKKKKKDKEGEPLPQAASGVATGENAALPAFKMQEIEKGLDVGYAVTLVDVDGDGKRDIVVVDSERVIWFQNPDWKMRTIIKGGTKPHNVCIDAHDIDGDGKIDFALGAEWKPFNTKSGGTLQWLKRGKTLDEPWTIIPIDEEPTVHRIRFADVDGDGKPELISVPLMGRGATAKNNWMDGSPVRITAYKIPKDPEKDRWTPIVLDESLHVVHNFHPVKGAGKGVNVLTASYEGVSLISSHEGKWSTRRIGLGNQENPKSNRGSSEIKQGTLKGGAKFIATIEPWHGDQVVVYTDRGHEGLWTRQVIDDQLKWGHAVWCADLDGDGGDELIIGVRDDKDKDWRRGVRIYKNVGEKWDRHIIENGGVAVEDLAAADLDGDGDIDIVAVGRQTHNARIYWNQRK